MNHPNKSSFLQIENSEWHIPRASLGSIMTTSSSSSSSNKSYTTTTKSPSKRSGKHNPAYQTDDECGGDENQQTIINDKSLTKTNSRSSRSSPRDRRINNLYKGQINRDIDKNPNGNSDLDAITHAPIIGGSGGGGGGGGIKRSSQSSQGSTDSNHSSHSASSGSLLLTAANLEQLAQIHKKNSFHKKTSPNMSINTTNRLMIGNENFTLAPGFIVMPGGHQNNKTIDSIGNEMIKTNGIVLDDSSSIIIPIDNEIIHQHLQQQRLHNMSQSSTNNNSKLKTKDLDTLSMASSTHFTMVNGVGGPQRKINDGICSRGHQITVLILTMSAMFLIGICGAVFLLELRAKKMPHM